jgi:hypothetical protein
MGWQRGLTLAVTAGALVVAPLTVATAADAAMPFSVSVLACGGDIHIRAYPTLHAARHALHKQVHVQKRVPHSLHKIELRHGSKVLRTVSRSC